MATKAQRISREWYQAYCSAMLETDLSKLFESVQCARHAIQSRLAELSVSRTGNNSETTELERALRFLNMLVNCSLAETGATPMLPIKNSLPAASHAMATAAQ
jgi:hypothetical protein